MFKKARISFQEILKQYVIPNYISPSKLTGYISSILYIVSNFLFLYN